MTYNCRWIVAKPARWVARLMNIVDKNKLTKK